MSQNSVGTDYQSLMKQALLELREMRGKLSNLESAKTEPIAVIGMGCRFPGGADNPETFWRLLRDGVDTITEVPKNRWDLDTYYDPDPGVPGKMYTRYGGFVNHLHEFDPDFFGLSPREAISLDPQQRLLLEVSWEALENSGLSPEQLAGTQTGVFIGICSNDYFQLLLSREADEIDAYMGTGNTHSVASGRLSYMLGLQGPSLAVDTACSSSLVTVHLACQSLRNRESDVALAGGVNRLLSPEITINFSKARMLAPDGRCKTFDAAANGYIRSEGCGVIVLKRLRDAVADRDNILALIRGSAVNQDGHSSGLTVPNGPAQQALLRRALENGGVESSQVSYIEAHGTGTSLGDPIEVGAIGAVFGKGRSQGDRLLIGSVKTNIGHLEGAAGIAGFIKVVLALQHEEIPPHLHFKQPNPHINWDELPVEVPTKRTPWPATRQRLAGVSSFGFSGTNAHVVLEAAPKLELKTEATERSLHLLTLSAKTKEALQQLANRYEKHLATNPVALGDICFTANTGREHFNHRLSVLAASTTELSEKLTAFSLGQEAPGVLPAQVEGTEGPAKIAFLFTGQGSQYVGMGRQLYEQAPTFRAALDRCAEILAPKLDKPLLEVLYPPTGETVLVSRLNETAYTQPALFALEYALYQLWKAWGVEPTVVLGHSVGEYVAACVAGVFSLESGLQLIAARGRLMQALPPQGEAEFEQVAQQVSYSPPEVALMSNVTGQLAEAEIATPEYWCRQILSPVHAASFKTLQQQGYEVFVEIGPQPTLLGMGQQCLPAAMGRHYLWLPSLQTGKNDWQQLLQSVAQLYLQGVSIDWVGFDRDYSRHRVVLPTYPFQRQRYWVDIKTNGKPNNGSSTSEVTQTCITKLLHQGETQQLTQQLAAELSPDEASYLPKILEVLVRQHQQELNGAFIKDRLYQLEWQPKSRDHQVECVGSLTQKDGSWLILCDCAGVGRSLAKLLQQQGQSCLLVYPGESYQHQETGIWSLNPSSSSDYERLFQEALGSGELSLQGVVHLWSLEATCSEELTIPTLEQAQVLGCGSVLHLVQALVKHNDSALPQLWLVTQGAMPVDSSLPAIAQTPLWGLGKAIALEHPELWGGMLDLAPESTNAEAAELLLAEIADSQGEEQLAFRSKQRYVARLVLSQVQKPQGMSLQPHGTYLITGGLGALGLKVAQWLVEQGARYLVLTGRSGASIQAQETITWIEQAGAKVLVAQADVSHEADMMRVLEEVKVSMPPLQGIVHTAGVLGYQAIKDMDLDALQSVLRPKVLGTWILHQLTQEMKLDFFVGFSSIASVWGSKGQAHYAAANHFLDALAYYRQGLGLPALSVNWGPWAEGGMASLAAQQWLARMGVKALEPDQALTTLGILLKAGYPQATVADVDWTLFKGIYEARKQRPLLEKIETQPQEVAKQPKQRSEILQRLEATQESERQALLIAYLQAEVAQVLGLELSQLPESQRGFFEMGMDSLMAVELKERLEASLGSGLPATLAFESRNIEALAEYLGREVLGWNSATDDAELVQGEDEPALALSQIEQLSEDEVEASIAERLTKLESLVRAN